jgi:hypothetical protein
VDGPLICFAAMSGESKANSRLIAAAPELLDVAIAVFRACDEDLIDNTSHEDSVGVLLDAARDVIAKATGVTP